MRLTSGLQADRRQRVESRLHTNLMAWLTTVSTAGKPDTVPVWYLLRDDETVLIYSRPDKAKLRNIEHNPTVARSEERRVGKEGRSRWAKYEEETKKERRKEKESGETM